MKQSTFKKAYENALIEAEDYKKKYPDEKAEVILVPIVVYKKNNNILRISSFNSAELLYEEENQD